MVIQMCTQYFDDQGRLQEMTDQRKSELLQTIEEMASRGLRTLAMTYTDFPINAFFFQDDVPAGVESNPQGRSLVESPDENLILMGIVGIKVSPEHQKGVKEEYLHFLLESSGLVISLCSDPHVYFLKHKRTEHTRLCQGFMCVH